MAAARGPEKAQNRRHIIRVQAALAGFHAADLRLRTIERVRHILAAEAALLTHRSQLAGHAALADRNTTTPADDSTTPFRDNWSPGPLKRIGQYFADIIQFVECLRAVDDQRGMKTSTP